MVVAFREQKTISTLSTFYFIRLFSFPDSIELACPQETLLFHAKPQGTFPLNLTVASRIYLKTSILS